MTDYTDLIARLRSDEAVRINWDDHINGRLEHRKPTARELEAADALEAQARRIAELEKMLAVHRLAVDVDALKTRIAELEAILSQTNEGYAECIATREDYRDRIAELEAALKPFIPENDMFEASMTGYWPLNVSIGDLRAARAAYLGQKK
jgi:hypothetical protein